MRLTLRLPTIPDRSSALGNWPPGANEAIYISLFIRLR